MLRLSAAATPCSNEALFVLQSAGSGTVPGNLMMQQESILLTSLLQTGRKHAKESSKYLTEIVYVV